MRPKTTSTVTTTGTGTLATTITLSPLAGTANTYNASVTATGSGQTDTEAFTITVTPSAALGATATLIGNFNTHKKFICFRVRPVAESFDVRNVALSGITLRFGGNEITALAERTHISLDCDDDDEDECLDCESDTLDCEPQLHACFSMPEIQALFGDVTLPSSLVDATVSGALTTGETFVATIGSKFPGDNGNHGKNEKKGLNSRVRPNPLNPTTELTFTLSQPGRIRVHIYDVQGRLVKTLLDENRPVGDQSVTWNGSSSRNGGVPSGVYYFRIRAPQGDEIQRVVVMK